MWSPSFVFKRMAFQWIEVRWMAKFVLALIIKHLLIACPFLTLMFHQLINCYFTLQVSDEAKYIKSSIFDRTRQLEELHARVGENSTVETTDKKAFEDEIQNSLNSILAPDNSKELHTSLRTRKWSKMLWYVSFFIIYTILF
jgi:cell division protein FtsL